MTNETPNSRKIEEPYFDEHGAERERLEWRLGGKPPTERALGRQEALDREVKGKIKEGLGDAATKDTEPS